MLVKRLSAAGPEVKVANSRGPETIEADLLANGARAVTSAEAVTPTRLRLCRAADPGAVHVIGARLEIFFGPSHPASYP